MGDGEYGESQGSCKRANDEARMTNDEWNVQMTK
jgi:hypothetical protein